jgi:hypothetical protein
MGIIPTFKSIDGSTKLLMNALTGWITMGTASSTIALATITLMALAAPIYLAVAGQLSCFTACPVSLQEMSSSRCELDI